MTTSPFFFDQATDSLDSAVLGISTSAKPSDGERRSACRSYLNFVLNQIQPIVKNLSVIDLSSHSMPSFDGRSMGQRQEKELAHLEASVVSSSSILLSIPAYWDSVGGVFKNFCDLLGGAAYDNQNQSTPFSGKPVGILVIGADASSTQNGAVHARTILEAMGARVLQHQVAITNPRDLGEEEWRPLHSSLVKLGVELAKAAVLEKRHVES